MNNFLLRKKFEENRMIKRFPIKNLNEFKPPINNYLIFSKKYIKSKIIIKYNFKKI